MRRALAAGILGLVALAAPVVHAEEVELARGATEAYDSSRDFMLEFNGGYYSPGFDGSPGLTGTPYKDIFGDKGVWTFGFELTYEIWQGFGSVGVGIAADYGSVTGNGIVSRTGDPSADTTSLNSVPVRVLAAYRFDLLARRYGIPLVPFAKVGLAYTFWWITNGDGGIATYTGKDQALGGKWGYELAAGLALELNFLDPDMGRELDQGFGINSVYLHGQFMRVTADNFGTKPGLDLTANTWMFGLGFEF